jgi:hypothetical protein
MHARRISSIFFFCALISVHGNNSNDEIHEYSKSQQSFVLCCEVDNEANGGHEVKQHIEPAPEGIFQIFHATLLMS